MPDSPVEAFRAQEQVRGMYAEVAIRRWLMVMDQARAIVAEQMAESRKRFRVREGDDLVEVGTAMWSEAVIEVADKLYNDLRQHEPQVFIEGETSNASAR